MSAGLNEPVNELTRLVRSGQRPPTRVLVAALLGAAALIAAACSLNAESLNRAGAIANYQAVFDTPGVGVQAVAAGSPNAAPVGLDVPGCVEGSVDTSFETHTVQMVNYHREHIGLPPVVADASMSSAAQRAALVRLRSFLDGVGGNPHDPFGSGHACVSNGTTDIGQIGSARSNLSVGYTTGGGTPGVANGPRGVVGQMRDNGAGNTSVGHRQGILSPLITRVGTGSAAWHDNATNRNYSSESLYWLDPAWYANPGNATSSLGAGYFNAQRAADIEYISWPPPGYTPDAVTYPRWSFSLNESGGDVDFSNATVSMTYNQTQSIPVGPTYFTNIPNGFSGAPDDVFVWEPELGAAPGVGWDTQGGQRLSADVSGGDARFAVKIENVVVDGVTKEYGYVVFVMDSDSF